MKCSDCQQFKTDKCETNPAGIDHEPVEQLSCFVSKHSKDIPKKQLLQNTSGQAKASAIPPEVKGWNWGAFLLPLVWGIYHGVWLSLLLFIPIINFFTAIVFGADGNKWAWQNRKWDSIEHFKRTQRMWALWGILLFLFTIILLIIFGFLAVGSEEYATSTISSSALSVGHTQEESTPEITQTPSKPDAGIVEFQQLKQGQLEQVALELTDLELQIAETEAGIKDAETARPMHKITVEEIIAALSSPDLGKKLVELKEQQSQLIANRQYLEQDIRELKQYTNIAKYYEFKKSQLDELTSRLLVLRVDIDQGTAGAQQEYNRLLPQRKFMQQDIEELGQLLREAQ